MNKEKRILIVVTSHDRIDPGHPTGLWLEEFTVPYLVFRSASMAVTVASPRGGASPVDPRSKPTGEQALEWAEPVAALRHTLLLESVKAGEFAAIFLPGGHGTMFDLPDNPTLRQLLASFAAEGKIIAAVCHGPAGLVGVRRPNGLPLVAGKRITAFTNEEEREVQLDTLMPFLLETRLRELGGNFAVKPNWSEHIEIDGLLITGQNPQSSLLASRAVIEKLTG